MNEEIQSKLQDDIDELFESKEPGEELSQDEVTGMKYLDQVYNSSDLSQLDPAQVVSEGQRLGCFAFTARLCTQNWQVPGSEFVIPKDTRVIIPIVSPTYNLLLYLVIRLKAQVKHEKCKKKSDV